MTHAAGPVAGRNRRNGAAPPRPGAPRPAALGTLPAMAQVRVVCFDLMDTLVVDPFREALEAGAGMPLDQLLRRRNPDAWPAFEAGHIAETEFTARLLPDEGFDHAAFTRARREGYAMVPGMRELLDALAGRARRWLASNYPVWVDEVLDRFALLQRLEGVTVSCREGVRKPHPAFFERLAQQTGQPASGCLLVDDRVDNCAAAEDAGLRAHRFDGAQGLARRLRAEGLDLGAGR